MSRSRRGSPPPSLRRQQDTRKYRKTVSVFCEGEKTEEQYLEALGREQSVVDAAAVRIQIINKGEGAVPLTLVEQAVAYRRQMGSGLSGEDEVWCVFDVEWPQNHPNLPLAMQKAQSTAIMLAISNPCFELWLTLHHQHQSGHQDNDQARAMRKNFDDWPGKSLDAQLYMQKRKQACQSARRLDAMHEANGTVFPHNNPSSGMYLLLDSVGGS